MKFGSFRASVENSYFENETAKQLIRLRKLIVKDQEQFDLLKPDLKTQM